MDFKSKVVEKCGDIEWENNTKLNLIKLTISGNNSEVKKILVSSIESKTLSEKHVQTIFRLFKLIPKTLKALIRSQILVLLRN